MLSGLLGNAREINVKELERELEGVLIPNETIETGFKILRDMFVFTSLRLILIDKQGLTGKKAEYHTIPYKSISHFAVETAGTFDADGELKIWLRGSTFIEKEFKRGVDVIGIQKMLAAHIL